MTKNCEKTASDIENGYHSILERFEEIVKLYPDKTAVKAPDFTLTYSELDTRSNIIANEIIARIGKESEPVAMLIDDGINSIITLFGIIKAGKFYVALDSWEPVDRLAGIIDDLQTNLIITDNINEEKALSAKHQIMNVDGLGKNISSNKIESISMTPNSLLGIYYTSGSTGKPKGVLMNHRTILFAYCRKEMSADHRYLNLFSYSFSASSGIFKCLLSGRALHLYPVQSMILSDLINYLIEEKITMIHLPVSMYRQLTTAKTSGAPFKKIEFLFLTGQSVFRSDIDAFKQHFSPKSKLVIGYSLNEAGAVTGFTIDRDTVIPDHCIPIGFANKHKEVSLLDDKGACVGEYQPGEIAVKSRYLSPGYWRNPELTREKFLPDPEGGDKRIYLTGDLARLNPEGYYEYIGRKDFQVKVRGFRIETEAVDAVLYSLDQIKDAVVVARNDHYGEKILIAYVVPLFKKNNRGLLKSYLLNLRSFCKTIILWVMGKERKQPLIIAKLRRALKERLPDYMIPTRFMILDELPLTPNGKVNRSALPEYKMNRNYLENKFVSPQTELEHKLIKIWETVLNVSPIGIHDDFFEHGGHSLLAVRLITEIKKTFDSEISVTGIYKFSTVKEMATMLQPESSLKSENDPLTTTGSSLSETEYMHMQGVIASCKLVTETVPHSLMMRMNTQGTKPPLFWCFNNPRNEQPRLAKQIGINQPLYGMISGIGIMKGKIPIDTIAKHYVDEILSIDPDGPYYIGGNCHGAKVAWQIVLRLIELGKKVERLCFMEHFNAELYNYSGKLLLLYGDKSHLKAYEPFHWHEEGWQNAFKVVPEVSWIPGAHGEFFQDNNIVVVGNKFLT